MSKRIHELAKEWNVSPKDLIAGLEKVGIRGKRSQSSLTDDEVQQAREALGLVARPSVPVGTERVVSERVVTEREAGDQLVTAREQTTETRLKANVIRRRVAREVLKREEVAPAPAEHELGDVPPALDFDADALPPSLDEVPPPAEPEPAPPLDEAPAARTAPEPAPAPEHAPTPEPPAPVAAAAAPAPAPAPARPVAARPTAPVVPAAAPPPGFEEMRG